MRIGCGGNPNCQLRGLELLDLCRSLWIYVMLLNFERFWLKVRLTCLINNASAPREKAKGLPG